MTPEQKIKWLILHRASVEEEVSLPDITEENIDDVYEEWYDKDLLWDSLYETREGEEETSLYCPTSRYYESKAVAAKAPDGTWVGWTYWYGGGKHGDPDSIEWMEEAYHLEVSEEEKLVVVREFSKIEK